MGEKNLIPLIRTNKLTPINGFFLQKNFREIFQNEVEKYDEVSVKIIEQRSKLQDLYTIISNNNNKDNDQIILNIIEEIFLNTEIILEKILNRIEATRNEQLRNLVILDSVIGSNYAEIYTLITNKKNIEILEKTSKKKV